MNIYKVESLIKELGWSNSYFCNLFSKNKGWISDWKRGLGLPDENMLACIADKLGTTIAYLTDVSEQKNKPSAEAKDFSPESINSLSRIEKLSPANRAKLSELIDLYLSGQDKT